MKVFCIGFNKTGTASLHAYFKQAGLASSHDGAYQAHSRTMGRDDLRAYLDAHDAFSDGERANFPRLLELYPDAKFILNTRGLKRWLESRVKHIFRGGVALAQPSAAYAGQVDATARDSLGSRPAAREYLRDPERAISDWIDRREFYHRSVMEFFATVKPHDFLRLNVTQDPQWQSELDSFLGCVARGSRTPGIHANAASADMSLPGMPERVRQVESVLVQKNIPRAEWDSDTYIGFLVNRPGIVR